MGLLLLKNENCEKGPAIYQKVAGIYDWILDHTKDATYCYNPSWEKESVNVQVSQRRLSLGLGIRKMTGDYKKEQPNTSNISFKRNNFSFMLICILFLS